MAYSCYVRHEGREIVEVQPTVTIRFDQLTTITRNRVRRVFEDNYCPYGWSSKSRAILTTMWGHYEVFSNLLAPPLINHPNFDKEMFETKALLLGYEFSTTKNSHPRNHRHGYGSLMYKGDKGWDDRQEVAKQMGKLTEDTLLPIARSFINHTKLAPIMDALENRQPYIFIGVNMR